MTSSPDSHWYVDNGRKKLGPFPVQKIRELLDQGEVQPNWKVTDAHHEVTPFTKDLTVINLIKPKSDPAHSLFDTLERARARQNAYREQNPPTPPAATKSPTPSPSYDATKDLGLQAPAQKRTLSLSTKILVGVGAAGITAGALSWFFGPTRSPSVDNAPAKDLTEKSDASRKAPLIFKPASKVEINKPVRPNGEEEEQKNISDDPRSGEPPPGTEPPPVEYPTLDPNDERTQDPSPPIDNPPNADFDPNANPNPFAPVTE